MTIEQLEAKVKQLKLTAFEMVVKAGKGHLGGSFSCAEALVALYYEFMRVFPSDPNCPTRDRFIMSKGHSNAVLYAILADKGFFSPSELDRYTQDGSLLGGHCDSSVPGIEVISGSLGHGLGIGCGIAKAAKLDGKDHRVFVIVGDGEMQEGSIWESLMFASQHKLDNLFLFVDHNNLGSEDRIDNTSNLAFLRERLSSFGWLTHDVNGHDMVDLLLIMNLIFDNPVDRPTAIILNTIKGNGMPGFENAPRSHHTVPKDDKFEICRRALSEKV
jgi:transketolase